MSAGVIERGLVERLVREALTQRTNGNGRAVSGSMPSISWKCRCGAVELPVWPTRPTTWPSATASPTRTATEPVVRCAYTEYAS